MEKNISILRKNLYGPIPTSLLSAEAEGLYGSALLEEINQILEYYNVYEMGADFIPEGSKDYTPANLRYKQAKKLINKEAAFMFARPLDFNVQTINEDDNETVKSEVSIIQAFLNEVLKQNIFNSKILKAAKDCFIGKRIAMILNFNDEGISLSFSPSLEFVYETDEADADKLTKIVIFYIKKDAKDKAEQQIYKKKYWMAEDGYCHVQEAIYDGLGVVIEMVIEDLKTEFEYIPGVVIVNEGLTGDTSGESDIENIAEYESWFSRLSNADIDSMRKGMNPIRYTRDMDSDSTKNLPISAGAYWDLQSDQNLEIAHPDQGIIMTDLSYSSSLDVTLERLKKIMHEQLSIPDVGADKLQGITASGKTFKAIYWELIIRCEEKFTVWRPALEFIAKTIVEGAKLYPKSAEKYLGKDKLSDVVYNIDIENNYPIPEDEQEEKEVDLSEVTANTMSKKSYMKKWRGLTDNEADAELQQIALERQLLEDSFLPQEGLIDEGEPEE